jgi:hypothetical protein
LIGRSKKLPPFFYESALGNRPVREWILGLSLEDRKLVGRDIKRSNSVGRSACPIAAVSATACGLHSFVNRTRPTPARDLRLALERMKEVL